MWAAVASLRLIVGRCPPRRSPPGLPFLYSGHRLHPGKKQILTLTNKFVRQDFFFLRLFFPLWSKNGMLTFLWVAYSPKNLPAAAREPPCRSGFALGGKVDFPEASLCGIPSASALLMP